MALRKANASQTVRWVGSSVVLIMALVIAFYLNMDVSPDSSAAQQAFLQGDYERSIEEFTTLIDANPQNALWYAERGSVYVAMGDYAAAQTDFETALTLNPEMQDPRPFRQLGYIYALNGNPQQAIEYLTRVMTDDSIARSADYTARGYAYGALETPDLEAAIADLEYATLLPDVSLDTYSYLADVHYALGNDSQALDNYRLYTELGGELSSAGRARVSELQASVDGE